MTTQIQQDNYNEKVRTYQLFLPLDIEINIAATESVRMLIEVTERMDL